MWILVFADQNTQERNPAICEIPVVIQSKPLNGITVNVAVAFTLQIRYQMYHLMLSLDDNKNDVIK